MKEDQEGLKVHGLPKMNFMLPESKQIDPSNISHYETPISITGPFNMDASNPDISLLTNSCLNLSNNQTELNNIDFGQNNHKRLMPVYVQKQNQTSHIKV